ncbi:uncharacterized protein LOC123322368 [Coccinella septempunctata]|uniref:uncharacterized protein LOC123322368 n=1 Tax=Coccinella septempunctata TaxID=41139 RepID=UPI001D06C886|nr:uncharacterized protein LOC123322368 [Coccinella septempunctata]
MFIAVNIYNRYYVCHSHFPEIYHLPGSKRGLTVDAVPTIGVPGTSTSTDLLTNEPKLFEVISVVNKEKITSEAGPSGIDKSIPEEIRDNHSLPPGAADTADLILFLGNLFDSLNVTRKSKSHGKPYKQAATKTSWHIEFWRYAVEVLSSMTFFCPVKNLQMSTVIPKFIKLNRTRLSKCTIVYMTGALIKTIFKNESIKRCDICRNNLLSNNELVKDTDFIEPGTYESGNLIKPGSYAHLLFSHSFSYLFYYIPRICERKNVSKILFDILSKTFEYAIMKCASHNLDKILCETIIRCILFWWC